MLRFFLYLSFCLLTASSLADIYRKNGDTNVQRSSFLRKTRIAISSSVEAQQSAFPLVFASKPYVPSRYLQSLGVFRRSTEEAFF